MKSTENVIRERLPYARETWIRVPARGPGCVLATPSLTSNYTSKALCNVWKNLLVLLCVLSSALSARVRLELLNPTSSVDPSTGKQGLILSESDQFSLQVTVENDYDDEQGGQPIIDGLDDCTIDGISQGSSFQSINGRSSAQFTYTYAITPHKTGSYTFGPARVETDRGEETSNQISARVLPRREYLALMALSNGNSNQLTCKITALNKTPIVGEVISVGVTLENRGRVQSRQLEPIVFENCASKLVHEGTLERRLVNGVTVESVTQLYEVVPETPGKIRIGPIQAVFTVPSKRQSSPFGEDPFFGGFGSFFSMNSGKRTPVVSNELVLDVQPLPAEQSGATPDGIGQFVSYRLVLPKRKAGINEPLTAQVILEGSGNFDAILPPELILPDGMRAYDPETKRESGKVTWEYLIQSGLGGKQVIPAQQFLFFDTGIRQYRTLSSDPVAVMITGASGAGPGPGSSPGSRKEGESGSGSWPTPGSHGQSHKATSSLPGNRGQTGDIPGERGENWANSQSVNHDVRYIPPESNDVSWLSVILLILCGSLGLFFGLRAYLTPLWSSLWSWVRRVLGREKRAYERKLAAILADKRAGDLYNYFEELCAHAEPLEGEKLEAFDQYMRECAQVSFAPDLADAATRSRILKKAEYWSLYIRERGDS